MDWLEKINFRGIALFEGLSDLDLVRLVPNFELMEFTRDETLCRQGDAGDAAFIIIEGKVSVSVSDTAGESRELAIIEPLEMVGEMALLTGDPRSATVTALTNVKVLRLRKERFDDLIKKHISFSHHLNLLLSKKIWNRNFEDSERAFPRPAAAVRGQEAGKQPSATRQRFNSYILGWAFCLIVPVLLVYFGPRLGLHKEQSYYLSVFADMVFMWVFRLADEYVPGLLALLVPLAMGLAPPHVILSGFASVGFFMAMSFLGLGAVLLSSGLSYRVLLLLLKRLPNAQFWHNLALMITGILLTPMIPTANGRVALTGPFAADMVELLGLKPGGAAATRLAVSAFTGTTLMSAVFLSSKSVNFVMLGLLPPQLHDQMQWIGWLKAGAVTGLVMFVLYLTAAALILANDEEPRLSKDTIKAQLLLLGKVSPDEWGAVVAIFIFVVGITTVSLHKIQPPWLGLTILCGLLLLGSLSKKEFREKIDWSFLMYLAEMVGIINVFNYLGLDKWVSGNLTGLGIDRYLSGDLSMFIGLMCVIIFVLRLAVPISAAIVILVTVFMPLAEIKGVNPWVVGFIILVLGEMWFFPFQCSYYLQLQDQNRGRKLYNEKTFLKFNLLVNVLKVAAIFASIPYWKFLGFL